MTGDDRRRIVILGSTGSIGQQAIDVVRRNPDRFEIVGLAAGSNEPELQRQARELGVRDTGLGAEGARDLAARVDAEVVLNAIVGAAGLPASLAALDAGKTLALANKESLVAGGEVCRAAAERGAARIVAVDSEHAAISQCLAGADRKDVARIVLTASGGPFRTRRDLDGVTPDEALAHPTWAMGPKITVDSATLMNKGLEVIEAHFLFEVGYDSIDVLVHPQSIIHGAVEMRDGSLILQAAPADMRIPIAAALLGEHVGGTDRISLDLVAHGPLDFEPVDHARFPALGLAYEAGRRGRTYPVVLNAANEVAVETFLGGRLAFTRIPQVVEAVLERHEATEATDLVAVLAADTWAREEANALLGRWNIKMDTDERDQAAQVAMR